MSAEREQKGEPGEQNLLMNNERNENKDPHEEEVKQALTGRMTIPLFLACAVCSLGSSFQFGYNIGVINNPELIIRRWINSSHEHMTGNYMTKSLNTFVWSVTVAIFSIGGMFGGLGSGWAADKFGRKGGMLLNNGLAFVGAALMASSKLADTYIMLIVGRFVIGLNAGFNTGFAPMYLTEISPINLRGSVGSIPQLLTTISILVSQVFGLQQILGNSENWPWLFALICGPAAFQLLTLPFMPESPKYNLIVKNRDVQAEKDLQFLRAKADVSAEMDVMRAEAQQIKSVKKVTLGTMFKDPALRWALSIAVVMMLAQQFSGINVAIYYSSNIFRGAGLTTEGASYATLGLGGLNVAMTVVSLVLVERFGRRVLLMSGLAGMAVCSVLLVIFLSLEGKWAGYVAMVFVLLFVVSFATGPGSIPWFYVSELFLQSSRGWATSIAVLTNWLGNFIVGLIFLPLNDGIHQYSFLLFTLFLVLSFVYTFFFVPETKGVPIETIVQKFKDGARRKF